MDEGGICSNCNNELVVINNKIYIKNLYESLYAMNDSINTTMEDAQTTKEEIIPLEFSCYQNRKNKRY